LDHKFAELTFKIPSELKLKGFEKKYIFKKALEPYLPYEVLKHKKQGFGVPLEIWFKSELKDYMYSVLSNRNSTLYDYLNFSYVQEILNQHIKGVKDYSVKIWSILFFDEWLKQNIDL
jgi:asparagine synthase (glutamine-hydrolysing)